MTDTPPHRRDYDELRQAAVRLSAHGQRLGTTPGTPLASLLKSQPADLADAGYLEFVENNWPAFVRYAERAYHYLSAWDLERIIHLVRQALTHWFGP